MIPKEQVSEFNRIITSRIETNTELMIKGILSSGDTADQGSLNCLELVKKGEEMLRIVKAYTK